MSRPWLAGESVAQRLRSELQQTNGIVNVYDMDTLLDRTDAEVAGQIFAGRRVPLLIIRWEDAASEGVQEAKVDVQHDFRYPGAVRGRPVPVTGDQVLVHVPFDGDRDFFNLNPLKLVIADRGLRVGTEELLIRMRHQRLTQALINEHYNSIKTALDRTLERVNADIEAHNDQLQDRLLQLVKSRRQRLLEQRQLTAALPFDIRPTGVRPTYPVPLHPRRLDFTQPRAARPFAPEPALEDAMYELILETIAASAHQLEAAPATFLQFTEEDLRNQLLVPLNSAFRGQAGAEQFRRAGKTDIVVKSGDRAVFVAECKIYDGPKKVADAVDQLLDYMVWRDSKAAIILFIKHKQATDLITKADAAIAGHPQCERREEPDDPESRINYVLRSTADDKRLIRAALLPVVVVGPNPPEYEELS